MVLPQVPVARMSTPVMVNLGPVDEIPLGEGRTFDVDGEQVAVFRLRDGSVCAVGAVCPHRGGPLADGQIDGSRWWSARCT